MYFTHSLSGADTYFPILTIIFYIDIVKHFLLVSYLKEINMIVTQ